MPPNVCATNKRRQWPLRPNRDLAMGRSVQTRCVRVLRGLDPPASGGVASRPCTAMGRIHAHSGCRDRSVPGRLPGRTCWGLGGPAAAGLPVRCRAGEPGAAALDLLNPSQRVGTHRGGRIERVVVTDQKQEEHVRFSSQNVGQSALAVLTGLAAPLHRRVLLTDPLAGHAGERPPRRPDARLGRGKQSSPRTASRRSQRTSTRSDVL